MLETIVVGDHVVTAGDVIVALLIVFLVVAILSLTGRRY